MSADEKPAAQTSEGEPAPEPAVTPWREIWQVPTLGVSVALLVIGLATTVLHRPAPDVEALLAGAERRIEARRYTDALDVLNHDLGPLLDRESFTPERRRRFHVLRARALSLGQSEFANRQEGNDTNIVREYREAERQGAALLPRDAYFLAQAYLGLGRVEPALKRADDMPPSERSLRHELYRSAIEQQEPATRDGRERMIELVSRFVADPTLGINDRAWAELQRARVLAATGDHAGVVDRLLRSYPQWAKATPERRAALSVELGAAQMELGELEDARESLELGERLAPPQSTERGTAVVLLGRLDELAGRPMEARDRYQQVLNEQAWSPAAQAARLGLAEVYAADGQADLALDLFHDAIETLREDGPAGGVDAAVLENVLLTQHRLRGAAGDPADALRYAQLAEQVSDAERSPELVLALAESHRAVAEELARAAGQAEGVGADSMSLDATTREEFRRHIRTAGGYYALHADLVTLDEAAFERSTWLSAVCFDRAGDLDLAERKLTTFVTAISESPMRAEARYRLGRIYQARARYAAAQDAFRSLIEDANDPETGKGVGPFALRAYVPLAETLLADADPDNDADARALLERVLSGGLVDPTSEEYRNALVELGTLHYRRGEYVQAIDRLREALARFEGERREHGIRFRLADAFRLEADRIGDALAQAMPGSERRELERVREERLRTSIEHFELTRDGLERLLEISAAEGESLRSAYFFLGACAYDLGDYELAVKHYAAAHAKYAGDPAALVPLIQIVSARLEQGELAMARAANERAQRLYESFPDEVWNDSALPLTREDWQRWFQASERLATVGG